MRNCIDQIKDYTLWLKASPKREGRLKSIYEHGIQQTTISLHSPLLNVCVTRWVENIDGWDQFSLCHPFLCETCEVIIYGDRTGNYAMFSDNWSAEDKRNAPAHLKFLESFEFIYASTTLQRSLLYLKEAAVKLQGQSQDIVSGFLVVEQCTTELKMLRENVDDYTGCIFQHSSRIANKADIPVTMPRIIQRQQHRSDPEYSFAQEYYIQAHNCYSFP